MMPGLAIRDMDKRDLDKIFEFQLDPEANRMAAFTAADPTDRGAFDRHWEKIFADDFLLKKVIELDGQVVGSLGKFEMFDLPQVTYWIARPFWGRGIATAALAAFLHEIPTRPIYGCAASDNQGSIRVLQKCGFVEVRRDRGFANARKAEIEEIVFRLD